ncbi:unnamed protein product, partial [Ixodes pacificus]
MVGVPGVSRCGVQAGTCASVARRRRRVMASVVQTSGASGRFGRHVVHRKHVLEHEALEKVGPSAALAAVLLARSVGRDVIGQVFLLLVALGAHRASQLRRHSNLEKLGLTWDHWILVRVCSVASPGVPRGRRGGPPAVGATLPEVGVQLPLRGHPPLAADAEVRLGPRVDAQVEPPDGLVREGPAAVLARPAGPLVPGRRGGSLQRVVLPHVSLQLFRGAEGPVAVAAAVQPQVHLLDVLDHLGLRHGRLAQEAPPTRPTHVPGWLGQSVGSGKAHLAHEARTSGLGEGRRRHLALLGLAPRGKHPKG